MNSKEKLLQYISNPYYTTQINSMGCSENWYNPYYAITRTFSKEEIEKMSDVEIENLVKLASVIGEALY